MLKYFATRTLALVTLALFIAGCSNITDVTSPDQDYQIGYLFTATLPTSDTPGTASVEKAAYFADGAIVTESDLDDLSTQQQFADPGDLADDMRQNQLSLNTVAIEFNSDGTNTAVTFNTTWRNETNFYLTLPSGIFATNQFGFRLANCFVVASPTSGRVGNDCDLVNLFDAVDSRNQTISQSTIAVVRSVDLGNDRELEPSGSGTEVMPPGTGELDFTAGALAGERISFFIVPTIPPSQVCTGTGEVGCGQTLPN